MELTYEVPERKIIDDPSFRLKDKVKRDKANTGLNKIYRSIARPMMDCGTDIFETLRMPGDAELANQDCPLRGMAKYTVYAMKAV